MTCTLVGGILVKKCESLSLYMCSAYSALEEGEAKELKWAFISQL